MCEITALEVMKNSAIIYSCPHVVLNPYDFLAHKRRGLSMFMLLLSIQWLESNNKCTIKVVWCA